MHTCISEDHQPNENLSRKAAGPPSIRSTASRSRGRGYSYRGRGRGYYQASTAHTFHSGISQNSYTTPYPKPFANRNIPVQSPPYNLLKRPIVYTEPPPENPPKRRRLELEPNSSSLLAPGPDPDPVVDPPKTPRTTAKRKKPSRKRSKFTETVVEVPPLCRKGIENSHQRRRKWTRNEIVRIDTQIGGKVHFHTYSDDGAVARFFSVGVRVNSSSLSQTQVQEDGSVLSHRHKSDYSDVLSDSDSQAAVEDYLTKPGSSSPSSLANLCISNVPSTSESRPEPFAKELSLTKKPIDKATLSMTSVGFRSGTITLAPPLRSSSVLAKLRDQYLAVLPANPFPSPDSPSAELPVHVDSDFDTFIPPSSELFEPTPAPGSTIELAIEVDLDTRSPAHRSGSNPKHSSKDVIMNDTLSVPTQTTPSTVAETPCSCVLEPSTSISMKLEKEGDVVRIPTHMYDKSRRILQAPSGFLLSVSLHGYIHRTDAFPLRRRHALRTPDDPRDLIDDACLLTASTETYIVLGHSRANDQVSMIAMDDSKTGKPILLERPWNSTKKGGVSAVATMMQPLLFATGGHDRVVHLWDVTPDFSTATARPLAIKHTALVQSLLPIRDTSHKLISASADCNVHVWDLAPERVVNTIKTSNSVYHVHPTSSPFCTLLEVAHREFQIEVRDHRLVSRRPVQRFGYQTQQLHGRNIKGASMANYFAGGDRDGSVRLWDLRNVRAIPAQVSCFPGHRITQVVFSQSRIIAWSDDNQVTQIKYGEI